MALGPPVQAPLCRRGGEGGVRRPPSRSIPSASPGPLSSREIGNNNRALLPWLFVQKQKFNKICCPLEGVRASPLQVRAPHLWGQGSGRDLTPARDTCLDVSPLLRLLLCEMGRMLGCVCVCACMSPCARMV